MQEEATAIELAKMLDKTMEELAICNGDSNCISVLTQLKIFNEEIGRRDQVQFKPILELYQQEMKIVQERQELLLGLVEQIRKKFCKADH